MAKLIAASMLLVYVAAAIASAWLPQDHMPVLVVIAAAALVVAFAAFVLARPSDSAQR